MNNASQHTKMTHFTLRV